MFGFHPTTERPGPTTSSARMLIQQKVQDILSELTSPVLGRAAHRAPAVRQFAVDGERYRVVVDVMPPNDRGESVPIVTIERVAGNRDAEHNLRERFRLTEKETRVAVLLAQRRSNAEIAESLHISPHTARRHTENVMLKLNVTSRYSVESALSALA